MEKPVNPHGSRGFKLADAPSAVETLEHLEQTLDNLDPVDTRSDADKAADDAERLRAAFEVQAAIDAEHVSATVPSGTLDAAADAVIADITGGDPSVDAFEAPVEGTLDTIGGENTVDPERE